MTDLILLHIDDNEPVRCTSLDHAKTKIESHGQLKGKAYVKWTPQGGGPVSALEYSPDEGSWVAYRPE